MKKRSVRNETDTDSSCRKQNRVPKRIISEFVSTEMRVGQPAFQAKIVPPGQAGGYELCGYFAVQETVPP